MFDPRAYDAYEGAVWSPGLPDIPGQNWYGDHAEYGSVECWLRVPGKWVRRVLLWRETGRYGGRRWPGWIIVRPIGSDGCPIDGGPSVCIEDFYDPYYHGRPSGQLAGLEWAPLEQKP